MKEYRDHYFKKAKAEQYPARSVYKLQEMDRQFKLLAPGYKVLDLGAAPGSWTKYAADRVQANGLVLAVDLQAIDLATLKSPRNVEVVRADVFKPPPELAARLEALAPFDAVISDMAPRTTGVKFTDQARSLDLAQEAFRVARTFLVRGGHFVVKVFMGPDVKELLEPMRMVFDTVKTFKPKSSRAESKEIFYLGLGYRGASQQETEEGN